MAEQKTRLPAVHLTQQDFVSTFPWGLTGDRVRIRMQEVENLLLDAESAAAMAVLLGHASFSDRLDEAWKTYLNAQNHDIHVCSQEKAGLTWCEEADPLGHPCGGCAAHREGPGRAGGDQRPVLEPTRRLGPGDPGLWICAAG